MIENAQHGPLPSKARALTLLNVTSDFLEFLPFWDFNTLWYRDYNQTILIASNENIYKILMLVKWSQVGHFVLIQEPPSQSFISQLWTFECSIFKHYQKKIIFWSSTFPRENLPKWLLTLKMMPIPFPKLYAPLNDIWLEIRSPIFQRCFFICISKKSTYNCPCKSRTFICKCLYVDVIMLLQYMDWSFNLLYK